MGEFVEPAIERLLLSGQDRWIDVKRELNAGEHDVMFSGLVKELKAGETPLLDSDKVGSYRILAYLVGWSFKDNAGKTVPVSAASVANLKKRTRDEIAAAIEAHAAQSEQAIDERKNVQGTESASSAI